MISLFSFLHTGTAFMVIVQFRGHLVRQYRACVVDSLGQQCYEQQKNNYIVGYSCTCTCIHREMHVYTGCIGGLLANTVHCILSHHTFPARRDGSRQLHGYNTC